MLIGMAQMIDFRQAVVCVTQNVEPTVDRDSVSGVCRSSRIKQNR